MYPNMSEGRFFKIINPIDKKNEKWNTRKNMNTKTKRW